MRGDALLIVLRERARAEPIEGVLIAVEPECVPVKPRDFTRCNVDPEQEKRIRGCVYSMDDFR